MTTSLAKGGAAFSKKRRREAAIRQQDDLEGIMPFQHPESASLVSGLCFSWS